MAQISKEKYYLKNAGECMKIITYSAGQFHVKLPEQVVKDLNLDKRASELHGATEAIVNDLFVQKVKEWENAVTVEEKVIMFRSRFQGALLKEEQMQLWHDGKYTPHYKCNTHYSASQGCWEFIADQINFNDDTSLGMTIDWAVLNKKTVNGKASYEFVSGRRFNSYRQTEKYTEIPHTPEREAFFLSLDESFARMIAKVYKALGDLTPEKLSLLSDSGQKLLS